jgi:SH3-like domain-containing protein
MRDYMNFCLKIFNLVVLSIILSSLVANSSLAASNSCKLRAYTVNKGSDFLNVRKQPNSQSLILAKLPGNTEVNVLKTVGNWVMVKPVSPEAQNIEFQGQGWVFTSLLGLSTRGYGKKSVAVFRQANASSAVNGRISSNTSVKLLSCQDDWALVEKGNVRGWLSPKDQCAAPLTTCS